MKKIWEQFLTWLKLKALPWFKKNWMIIANYLVIAIAYNNVYEKPGMLFTEFLLGIWIFISIGVGGYRLFMKK